MIGAAAFLYIHAILPFALSLRLAMTFVVIEELSPEAHHHGNTDLATSAIASWTTDLAAGTFLPRSGFSRLGALREAVPLPGLDRPRGAMPDTRGVGLIELEGYVVSYDAAATTDVYERIRQGDSERCTCAPCITYIEHREQVYTPEFRAFLQRLGVDWHRDSEVHYIGKGPGNLELYGGCFHFIGDIRQAGDRAVRLDAGPTFDFSKTLKDVPPEFAGLPVVQLNFDVAVPARLSS